MDNPLELNHHWLLGIVLFSYFWSKMDKKIHRLYLNNYAYLSGSAQCFMGAEILKEWQSRGDSRKLGNGFRI